MKSKIFLSLLISLFASCFPTVVLSQRNQLYNLYPAPQPTNIDASAFLRNGIGTVINGLDDFTRAWGFQTDQLDDAAQLGVKSAGWNISQSSNFVVVVSLSAIAQREEDLYAFKIEVHGGSTALDAGDSEALGTLGDVSAARMIHR
ncbi:MAG: hypothetical protein HYR76_08210 [Ignavibacteria bacterium]|nr:hypothetical protein [Ignavibacteria bacterium]